MENGVCDVVLGERLPVSVTVVPGPMETRKVVSCKGNVTVAPVARIVAPVAIRGLWAVIVSVFSCPDTKLAIMSKATLRKDLTAPVS